MACATEVATAKAKAANAINEHCMADRGYGAFQRRNLGF
jgi:hypothetical protein